MLSRKQTFYQYIETNLSSSGILSSEQISGIINIYSGPCPTSSKSERQKYYRVRKTYIVKHLLKTRYLYRNESPTPLRVVAKEELFDLFEKVHIEGGKHLGRAIKRKTAEEVVNQLPMKLPMISLQKRN